MTMTTHSHKAWTDKGGHVTFDQELIVLRCRALCFLEKDARPIREAEQG